MEPRIVEAESTKKSIAKVMGLGIIKPHAREQALDLVRDTTNFAALGNDLQLSRAVRTYLQ